MPLDPASIGIAAGINAAAPFIAKGIGSLFGLDENSEEENRAAARRQQVVDRLTAAAEGRAPSAAQLAATAQQQRTQQALQGLAQRGSVQQRAGNVRAAMQAAPEVMAQQGAQLAATRAAEMESARNALAQAQMGIANMEAAQGAAKRQYMQGLIGGAMSGAASAATLGLKPDEKPKEGPEKGADELLREKAAREREANGGKPLSISDYGTASQAQTAEPRDAIRRTGMGAARGVGMAEGPTEPYGAPQMGDLGIGASSGPFQLQFGAPSASPVLLGSELSLGRPMIGMSPRVRRAGVR